MAKKWHNFKNGEQYSLNEVVAKYEERIRSRRGEGRGGETRVFAADPRLRPCYPRVQPKE